jgi:peroxiredoxin
MTARYGFRLLSALMVFAMAFPAMSFALGRLSPEATRKAIEERAPDFTLKDLNGRTFRLSEQRGKPVLLIFSTTWCPSCREEIPYLKSIHGAYAAKGLEMVSIDIQEEKKKVSRFAEGYKIPYRTLLDAAGDVATAYGVQGIPNLILVDRNGSVVCRECSSLEAILEKMFRKR